MNLWESRKAAQVTAALLDMDNKQKLWEDAQDSVEGVEWAKIDRACKEAEDRYEALVLMSVEDFRSNMEMAKIYARVTGSVYAEYNGVRWTR